MAPSFVVFADVVLYIMDKNANLIWKITDFGFSSTGTSAQRPLSFGRKTRIYFSPELLLGSAYDVKSDIWSAGCVLYEIATGHPPSLATKTFADTRGSEYQLHESPTKTESLIEINEMVANMLNSSPKKRPDADSVLKNIPGDSNRMLTEISKSEIKKINCNANLGANHFLARVN